MQRLARWIVVSVLFIDAGAALLLLSGTLSMAEPAVSAANPEAISAEELSADALRSLGQEIAARSAALQRREMEIEELLRGEAVLERAGILEEVIPATPEQETEQVEPVEEDPRRRTAFLSLGRAYENMEPDSAALAMSSLAARDKQAVVELLLSWQPRTSGAILDALTQADPALAADLSYEIWNLSGKKQPEAAGDSR